MCGSPIIPRQYLPPRERNNLKRRNPQLFSASLPSMNEPMLVSYDVPGSIRALSPEPRVSRRCRHRPDRSDPPGPQRHAAPWIRVDV